MRGQRGPGTCLRPSVQLWLDSVWLCPPCRKATTNWWGHVPAITIISNRILSVTRALVLCHTTPHSQPPEKPSIQDRLIYRTVRQWLSPNSFTSCAWLDSEHTLNQLYFLSCPTHLFFCTIQLADVQFYLIILSREILEYLYWHMINAETSLFSKLQCAKIFYRCQ